MLWLVTVCRPGKAFIFLIWASSRLYCRNNNDDGNKSNDDDDDDDGDDNRKTYVGI